MPGSGTACRGVGVFDTFPCRGSCYRDEPIHIVERDGTVQLMHQRGNEPISSARDRQSGAFSARGAKPCAGEREEPLVPLVIRDDVQVSFSAQSTGFQDETPHGCSSDFAGTGASKPVGVGLNSRKTFTSAGKEQVTAVRHNPGSAFIREIQNRIKVRRPARAENPSQRR